MPMRVLVTGAGGFVGASVVSELRQRGHEVVACGRAPAGGDAVASAGGGEDSPSMVVCDVTDAAEVERIFADRRPNHVVHAAAITPDRRMEIEESRRVIEVNELGTHTVLLAAARHGVGRVVYVSSSAVYAGAEPDARVLETAPLCDECGLYAVTKLAAERLCHWVHDAFGLDTRIARLGPIYGPFERPTGSRQAMSTVYVAIRRALVGEPLRAPAAAAGWRRDWLHGDDAARAIGALLEQAAPAHRVYNLSGTAITTERLLAAVAAAVPGTGIEWVDDPSRANIAAPTIAAAGRNLDCRRLEEGLGVRPQIGIEEGVRREVARLVSPSRRDGAKEDR